MTDKFVHCEDKTSYQLGNYLRAGLIGVVYYGEKYGNTYEKVAVKVPPSGAQGDISARFELEYEVMKKIAKQFDSDDLPIPWVKKGTVDATGSQALVMEFIGEDLLLSKQLFENSLSFLERETFAINAALKYADLLVKLHGLGYTCQDRKLTDIRWKVKDENVPQDGRLVVLDWNVVQESRDFIPDDIFLFGSLWFQLLVSKYASPDPDPLDEKLWSRDENQTISLGARRIISKALANSPAERYHDASELLEALQEHRKILEKSSDDLVGEAKRKYSIVSEQDKKFQNIFSQHTQNAGSREAIPLPDCNGEWEALIKFDMAWRNGRRDMEVILGECRELVKHQADRLIKYVKHNYQIVKFKEGADAAQWATEAARRAKSARLEFRVARWKLLLHSRHTALDEKLDVLPKIWEDLAGWVGQIEELLEYPNGSRESAEPLEMRYKEIVETIPWEKETRRILSELQREVIIKKFLYRADEFEKGGKIDLELDALSSANNECDTLKTVRDRFINNDILEYCRLLASTLPNIAKRHAETEKKLKDQAFEEEWQADLVQLARRLHYARGKVNESLYQESETWLKELTNLCYLMRYKDWGNGVKAAYNLSRLPSPRWAKELSDAGTEYIKLVTKLIELYKASDANYGRTSAVFNKNRMQEIFKAVVEIEGSRKASKESQDAEPYPPLIALVNACITDKTPVPFPTE